MTDTNHRGENVDNFLKQGEQISTFLKKKTFFGVNSLKKGKIRTSNSKNLGWLADTHSSGDKAEGETGGGRGEGRRKENCSWLIAELLSWAAEGGLEKPEFENMPITHS